MTRIPQSWRTPFEAVTLPWTKTPVAGHANRPLATSAATMAGNGRNRLLQVDTLIHANSTHFRTARAHRGQTESAFFRRGHPGGSFRRRRPRAYTQASYAVAAGAMSGLPPRCSFSVVPAPP